MRKYLFTFIFNIIPNAYYDNINIILLLLTYYASVGADCPVSTVILNIMDHQTRPGRSIDIILYLNELV